MTDLNHVVVIGRLTKSLDDSNFGYLQSGTARANISLAVNRSRKDGEQWVDDVSFLDVTIWGKTAENLKPYLQKGKQVAIDGYLKQDRWEKDGQKFSKVYIVANSVQLINNTSNSENSNKEVATEQQVQGVSSAFDDIMF
jgi:single-strand DNA-binding protein